MSELTPAPRGYPIKLVRDRTAEIINGSGSPGELFYDDATEDVGLWLRKKLIEEVAEYALEPAPDELADILAVVEGLARQHDLTLAELTDLMHRDPRGGFLTGQMMRGYHAEFDGRSPQEEER